MHNNNNNNSCADDTAGCVISSVHPSQAFPSTPGAGSSPCWGGCVVRAAFHGHVSSGFRSPTLLCRASGASWMGLAAPNLALQGSVSIGAFAVSLWCNGDKLSLSFGFPLLQDTGPIFLSHWDLQAGKALWNLWKVTEQGKDFKRNIFNFWSSQYLPDFYSKTGTWKSPRWWWTLWNQPVPRWKEVVIPWIFSWGQEEIIPSVCCKTRGHAGLSVVVPSFFFLKNLSCLTQIFLRWFYWWLESRFPPKDDKHNPRISSVGGSCPGHPRSPTHHEGGAITLWDQ